jgi:hypothetical protein
MHVATTFGAMFALLLFLAPAPLQQAGESAIQAVGQAAPALGAEALQDVRRAAARLLGRREPVTGRLQPSAVPEASLDSNEGARALAAAIIALTATGANQPFPLLPR